MKFQFDRKYLKVCLYVFFTAAALLLFHRILSASDNIWQSFWNGISFVLKLLSPFVTAILIAYILSPAVSGIEILLGKIFRKKSRIKGRKLGALIFVYVATVALLALTLSYVLPGIVRNINDLLINWQVYYKEFQSFYTNLLNTYPLLTNQTVQQAINGQLELFKSSLAVTKMDIISSVLRLGSSIASAVIGLILSFYLLNEREVIIASFSRLIHARLSEKRASAVMNFLNDVDKVFGGYISAKLLICVVLFVISLVIFSFFGVRYTVLMSAIVALSTLVPYIGPFVGAVPPIVISLLDSPQKAIYVAISILVLHFVDGYFIEPYVISDRLGLSPFWILLSIILGGGLFGLWGVLLAVPVAAVIKLLIHKYINARQLRRRREQGGAPSATPDK